MAMGQHPVPPVNIPIPTKILRLKWVVNLSQNATIRAAFLLWDRKAACSWGLSAASSFSGDMKATTMTKLMASLSDGDMPVAMLGPLHAGTGTILTHSCHIPEASPSAQISLLGLGSPYFQLKLPRSNSCLSWIRIRNRTALHRPSPRPLHWMNCVLAMGQDNLSRSQASSFPLRL